MNRYDLAGRSLIVTGGAGGIGRAIARVALDSGARVSPRRPEKKRGMVNAITPAAAETAMAQELTAERRADIVRRIPLGRFVDVDEIARMVAFLCSDDCSFSTGAVFDLSGGRATY